jgi:hypothetical protein
MATLTSPRHPNWLIAKEDDRNFTMWHKDYKGYAIAVFNHEGVWLGEILTEQKIKDFQPAFGDPEMEWLPAQSNPMVGPVEKVKSEVLRRGQYWQK